VPQGVRRSAWSLQGWVLLNYQWERETSPNSNSFVALADGSTSSWDGGGPGIGGIVSGPSTADLTIAADTANGRHLSAAHAIRYRCAITNACGNVASDPANLTVFAFQAADIDGNGLVNGGDIQPFVDLLLLGSAPGSPFCAADMNQDGAIDVTDVPLLVTVLLGAQ
jgi:hypothetical protein